jgi:hypothetical protein
VLSPGDDGAPAGAARRGVLGEGWAVGVVPEAERDMRGWDGGGAQEGEGGEWAEKSRCTRDTAEAKSVTRACDL